VERKVGATTRVVNALCEVVLKMTDGAATCGLKCIPNMAAMALPIWFAVGFPTTLRTFNFYLCHPLNCELMSNNKDRLAIVVGGSPDFFRIRHLNQIFLSIVRQCQSFVLLRFSSRPYLAPMKSGSDHLFPVYQVDAFAEGPFTGNPAAVVFLMGNQSDAWLQRFAMEMNLSETAYFMRKGDGYTLRWFTPLAEVDLCGHATLAAAHVIWETSMVPEDEEIRFESRSGLLRARKDADWIALDFPEDAAQACSISPEIAAAVPEKILWCGENSVDLLLELESEAQVRAFVPDLAAIKALNKRGLIITAAAADADGPYHFVSRFFGPSVGVDEDPVTGSAHCALGPYWAAKLDRSSLIGYQASARGGIVKVRLRAGRVELRGKATTVLQGVITKAALG
jgi:PhzF family phenazine biosynthesis protein